MAKKRNIIVGQSGGPTAVINSSLAGVYKNAIERGFDKVYGMLHGIQGLLDEQYIDLSTQIHSELDIELLKRTPSAFLGSCRFKLPEIHEDKTIYEKIFGILNRLDIDAFIYIGGNDSMDTIKKLSDFAILTGQKQKFLGVPKTIDNDLALTDHTPGFGSAAKYIGASTKEDEDKMVIHIDPGTAFGTGMHETTQLCIRQIRKYTTETTKILDVGCGSGILGMLALKFGAEHSVGTDLDPCAIDATYENMENNGVSRDKYEVMIGNIINDKEVQDKVGYECYDIVAANILAPVLVELTPVIVNQLKPGGIYITSGIIDDKEEMVKEAVAKAGLELLDVTYQGEWVCVTARKNA